MTTDKDRNKRRFKNWKFAMFKIFHFVTREHQSSQYSVPA